MGVCFNVYISVGSNFDFLAVVGYCDAGRKVYCGGRPHVVAEVGEIGAARIYFGY